MRHAPLKARAPGTWRGRLGGNQDLWLQFVQRMVGSSLSAILSVSPAPHPRFTDKETEAQSGQVTWRRSHSQQAGEPGF